MHTNTMQPACRPEALHKHTHSKYSPSYREAASDCLISCCCSWCWTVRQWEWTSISRSAMRGWKWCCHTRCLRCEGPPRSGMSCSSSNSSSSCVHARVVCVSMCTCLSVCVCACICMCMEQRPETHGASNARKTWCWWIRDKG